MTAADAAQGGHGRQSTSERCAEHLPDGHAVAQTLGVIRWAAPV